jgi:hypothetical protein
MVLKVISFGTQKLRRLCIDEMWYLDKIKYVVKQDVLPSKEEPKKIEFDLKDDESDSTKEQ